MSGGHGGDVTQQMKKISMGQGKTEKEKEMAGKVERYDAPAPQAGPSQASRGRGGETKAQNDKGKGRADPDDPKKETKTQVDVGSGKVYAVLRGTWPGVYSDR